MRADVDLAVTAAPTPARRLDIQGMRAFALIIILAYHARLPIHGGFIALDLFFVISGFVITEMLMRERARSGRIDLKGFYLRRFRRLTPALALTVSVVVLVAVVLESPFGTQQNTAATAVGSMLLMANVVIARTTGDYFAAAADQNPLLNIWSLSTEEQFYLVFPSIMVLAWFVVRVRRWPARRVLLLVVGGMALVSFVLAVLTSGPSLDWPWTSILGYYGAVGRAWEFAAGAVLALYAAELARIPSRLAGLLAWSGLLAIGAGILLLTESIPYPGWATLIPVYGSGAIIAAGCAARTSVSRLMSVRPMVWLGDMSYSWYLWHWPIIVFALLIWPQRPYLAPILAVAFSFVVAYGAYRYVELPIRRASSLPRRRTVGLAVACLGVPLALAGCLAVGARQAWWMDWPTAYDYRDSWSYRHGCHDTAPGQGGCRTVVDGEKGTVLLLGDSQALALSDGLIAANTAIHLATETSSHSQCPFITAGRLRFDYDDAGCGDWQRAALDYALSTRPDVVVIANRPYVDGMTGGVTLLDPAGRVPGDAATSSAAWVDALDAVVRPLREAGIAVVLAQAPPEASYVVPPSGMLQRTRIRATTSEALARRAQPLAADQSVARANPGTQVYDPFPVLCGPEVCPDVKDGAYLYADPRHLSVAGSMLLEPALQQAMENAAAT